MIPFSFRWFSIVFEFVQIVNPQILNQTDSYFRTGAQEIESDVTVILPK